MSPCSKSLLFFLSVRTFDKPPKNVEVTEGSNTPDGVFEAPTDDYVSVMLEHEAEHVTKVVVDKNKHLEKPVFKRFVLYLKTHSLAGLC